MCKGVRAEADSIQENRSQENLPILFLIAAAMLHWHAANFIGMHPGFAGAADSAVPVH